MDMLRIEQVSKSYRGKLAVDQVSFQIKAGEAYGLLGPNGAGKSTIIHMIAGILEGDTGEIYIGDLAINKQRKKAQQLIGVVPQDIALYPEMSAEANLHFFGKLYGLRGKELEGVVEENLRLVGLFDRRKEPIKQYSGGMKRRINIAAALLHQPKLLMMDEPTVGIDPQSRSHILETVKKLQREKGMSILYTSHYMEEVEAICDRVGIIDHGKLITDGTINEVKERFGKSTQIVIHVKDFSKAKAKVKGLLRDERITINEKDQSFTIQTNASNEQLPKLLGHFQNEGCEIRSLQIVESNLETIFLTLTGRSLRD